MILLGGMEFLINLGAGGHVVVLGIKPVERIRQKRNGGVGRCREYDVSAHNLSCGHSETGPACFTAAVAACRLLRGRGLLS